MVLKSVSVFSVLITFLTVAALATLSVRASEEENSVVMHLPAQFTDTWLIYDLSTTSKWVAMTLHDGSLTPSINAVLSNGVAKSKRESSVDWASFIVAENDELLSIQFSRRKTPQTNFISDRSIDPGNNFSLEGCFVFDEAHELDQAHRFFGNSEQLCFEPDGKFATYAVTSDEENYLAFGGRDVATDQGNYLIDNRIITFRVSDGRQFQTLLGVYRFGEQAPKVSAISIGERILFQAADKQHAHS